MESEVQTLARACGSLLSVLGSDDPKTEFEKLFPGDQSERYVVSREAAEFKCMICVLDDTVYCAMDLSRLRNEFLSVKPLAELTYRENATAPEKWMVSGQVMKLAGLVPIYSLLDIARKSGLSRVVLCGNSFSGSVCHAAAIRLNSVISARSSNEIVAKSVSFSGILCGSPALSKSLESSGKWVHHMDINVGSSVLGRVVYDFQRLSPLTASGDIEQWRSIYETIYKYSAALLVEGPAGISEDTLTALASAERGLQDFEAQHKSAGNSLLPLGSLYSNAKNPNGDIVHHSNCAEIQQQLVGMHAFSLPAWSTAYHLSPSPTVSKNCPVYLNEFLVPKISHISMQSFASSGLCIRIEGSNLECVLKRHLTAPVYIEKEDMSSLPISVSPAGAVELLPDARLLAVSASYTELEINMTGLKFNCSSLVTVNTDFGPSRPVPFDIQGITKAPSSVMSTPTQSLHPTMNAEFLRVVLLRVALCVSQSGGLVSMSEEYPVICTLWEQLVELDRMCNFEDEVLEKQMDLYASRQIDIAELKEATDMRLREISEHVTMPFRLEENILKKGFRKTLGGVSKVGGALLGVAGALISLPAVLLSVPGIMVASRSRDSSTPRGVPFMIGAGVYVGLVGVVGLPSLIVSTLASGLNRAGDYALKDRETLQYKEILHLLIEMLGVEQADVVDEVMPLEDYFITSFSTRFPGCDLSECTHEELISTIRKAVSTGSLSAANFIETVKKLPVILTKMRIVGRVHSIRRLLHCNLMVAFIGVKGSGTSSTVKRLFDVSIPASELLPTNPLTGLGYSQPYPHPYTLGKWMESAAEHSESLSDWLDRYNRKSLQVYAVDFPGIDWESAESIESMGSDFTGVASMFVLFLTAGSDPTEAEKNMINMAKAHHKPFVVLVNKCDTIQTRLMNSGSVETLIDKYATALNVSPDVIHLASSFDSYSIDKLRGILFGLLQNVIGEPSLRDVLALKFLPEGVISELRDDESLNVLSSAGTLSKAATSLMFNLCPMTVGTISDMHAMLLSDRNPSDARLLTGLPAPSKNILHLSFATTDQIRQVAVRLRLSDFTYGLFFEAFSTRASFAKTQLVDTVVPNFSSLPTELQSKMDNAVSVIALSSMRAQLGAYLGKVQGYNRDDIETTSREVLLGVHSIMELWTERGYDSAVVAEVLKAILSSSDPLVDSAILTLLLDAQTRHTTLKAHSGSEHKDELAFRGNLEFNKFAAAKVRLVQLSNVLQFQPFPEFYHSASPRSTDARSIGSSVDQFRDAVKEITKKQSSDVLITVRSSEGMTLEILDSLMSLTRPQLESGKIRFQILSESAVDVNGVTCAVLSKVAQEINTHPEMVHMKKDEDSKLIYFDPSACCRATSGGTSYAESSIGVIYRGLGRLVGLCLIKSNVGATLPINFPITLYKVLLGHRIGIDDLSTISAQVANSIRSIAILDEASLELMELTFVASSGDDHSAIDLVTNGSRKIVSEHNVMSYVAEMVQFYLCCKRGEQDNRSDGVSKHPLRQFLLGVQDFCPRDLIRSMSPITLQTILEGKREIDVAQWKLYADIGGAPKGSIHITQFWEVVSDLSDEDKAKLLCFSIGTTSLPSKGFEELTPAFHIVFGTSDEDSLPTSHTCFHMLILPKYPSKEILKSKLLIAIRETDTAQLGIV